MNNLKLAFREVTCPICPTHTSRLAFYATDRLHGYEGRFQYVRCKNCRVLFMNPQVTPESMGRLYPDDYSPHMSSTQSSTDRKFGNEKPTRPSLLKKICATIYLASKSKIRCFLSNVHLEEDVWSMLTPDSRVLDVGCGSGNFLNSIKERTGAQVVGLDFSENASKTALAEYGIEIKCGTFETVNFEQQSFDLITAWWFLEHVNDPITTLKAIHRLLKPEGRFVLGIPNSRSLNAALFRDRWYHLDCPRHLYLWTPKSIKMALKASGLKYQSIRHDKTPWGLLGSLQYAIYGNNFNKEYANKIKSNSILRRLLLPFSIVIGLLRFSDIIIVSGSKEIEK